jgi:hypothetical protein
MISTRAGPTAAQFLVFCRSELALREIESVHVSVLNSYGRGNKKTC